MADSFGTAAYSKTLLIVVTVYEVTLNNQKAGFRVEGFGFGGLGDIEAKGLRNPRFRVFGLLESRSGIVISIM